VFAGDEKSFIGVGIDFALFGAFAFQGAIGGRWEFGRFVDPIFEIAGSKDFGGW